ncbi:transcriptional regulator domain-containing protein [Sphingomonas sp. DBB INV C78]|uniref:transcriptional regulator domain-containing protein n=1 Tax=Sphingomonas sp. DBB INV C78 TaxID=3349434 RepID=UPI0036D22958
MAAEFLRRNRTYRAEHAQMRERIASGAVAKNAAEAAFARRWGLSFRHGTG